MVDVKVSFFSKLFWNIFDYLKQKNSIIVYNTCRSKLFDNYSLKSKSN